MSGKRTSPSMKKQSDLFSFFSKKSSATSSTSSPTFSTKPPLASTSLNPKIQTQNSHTLSSNTCGIGGQSNLKVLAQIEVGSRLSVYWPDDKQYYSATVTAKKRHASKENRNIFTLLYDDDEVETLDLTNEKFKILNNSATSSPEMQDSDKEECKTKSSNKKRTIIEEDEYEFNCTDNEEENEQDDASEFSAPGETEEDEEDDASMISDDDEVILGKSQKTVGTKRLRETIVVNPYEKQKKKRASSTSLTRPVNDKSFSSFITPPSKNSSPSFSNLKSINESSQITMTSPTGKTAKKLIPDDSWLQNTNTGSTVTPSSQSTPTKRDLPFPEVGVVNAGGAHYHNHFTFLEASKRRDLQNRPTHHPEYDPHTLRVDYNEIEIVTKTKVSDAMKQWWELKARYADTLLLFKTGKFYEMHHGDADIAVEVLGFNYMKGAAAHAGFPEIKYGFFCEKLVKAGYKVARIEQTETPEMLKERKKSTMGKKPKVVNREVCSIVSAGTRTFCYMDDTKVLEKGDGESFGSLLAIKETLLSSPDVHDNDSQAVCEYGIAVVDACTGVVTLGQFADDVLRNRMNTLLTTLGPVEVLVESGSGGASPTLLSLLKSVINKVLPSCRLESISAVETFPKSTAVDAGVRSKIERPKSRIQPWNVTETIAELHRKGYYPRSSRKEGTIGDGGLLNGISRWPAVLQICIRGGANLALSAFGASLFYLQRSMIDEEILSMGEIKAYCPYSETSNDINLASNDEMHPSNTVDSELSKIAAMEQRVESGIEAPPKISEVDRTNSSRKSESFVPLKFDSFEKNVALEVQIDHMALDGTTIANLEILTNLHSNTVSGSLWSKINYAKSPHGSRMLRAWLLRPLFQKADIDRRADAVEELTVGSAAVSMSEARAVLGRCGDMERLLSRVHSMSGSCSQEEGGHHPNDRAVLYETPTHTRRKVEDFSKLLDGLRAIAQIPDIFSGVEIQSGMLGRIVRTNDVGGLFPSSLPSELDWFYDNFDCALAARGEFEPTEGVDENYDIACSMIKSIKHQLEEYKEEICSTVLKPSHLVKNQWKYSNIKDNSKDKYLIELPANINVPGDFILKAKRGKGAKQINKYRTPVIERLVQNLEHAIDVMKDCKEHGMQLVFAKFDSRRSLWASAVQASSMLDALGALAEASTNAGYCRPIICDCPVDCSPSIAVEQGRHPSVAFTHGGGDFIPNDLSLGGDSEARMLLLSGPNMGGKSTLLRQTCLIAILAQIGCFVPAQSCKLTPFDRIFTRLGASDRILLGQSTFFVELAETAAALRGASRRSLVIMDELGRGTSTFDGTAIASATVKHLVDKNGCLTLFATHYHSLLEDFKDELCVKLGHMQCVVVDDEKETNCMGDDAKYETNVDDNITFLYTLGEGSCPKSFGINVARLAGLPAEVLSKAREVSSLFEATINETVTVDCKEQVSSSAAPSFIKRLNVAVKKKNLSEVERLWDELQ